MLTTSWERWVGCGQVLWWVRLTAKLDILRLTTRGLVRRGRFGRSSQRISACASARTASSALGGKARAGPGAAAHDAQAARERQSVWVVVSGERHLVHQGADRVVSKQVSVDLLANAVASLGAAASCAFSSPTLGQFYCNTRPLWAEQVWREQ